MHQSVLLNEAIESLAIQPDGIYIDGTFGRGGHSRAILKQLGPKGRLIAIDKDPDAINASLELKDDARFSIEHASFAELESIANKHGIVRKINGILLDLGVSSPQLDEAHRGFSFMREGPLDMRMDPTSGESVSSFLSHVDEKVLADILWQYGEEKFSRKIARAIVEVCKQGPIATTTQLADIVKEAMPFKDPHKHPATRTFQALRIYINRELEDLEICLEAATKVLAEGGRLAVISFHSLEDRIVKQFMQEKVKGKEIPRHLPLREVDIKSKGGMHWIEKMRKATEDEITDNVRARSAILRVVENRWK